MTSHAGSKLVLIAVAASLLTFCGGSDGPSDEEIDAFITGFTASDGSVAQQRAGSPPTPNGGPDLTVTSSGSVAAGGADVVRPWAASPFQKIYVDVTGATGFYEIPLNAATTDISVTARLAADIPKTSFLAGYRAASPAGLVGQPSTVNNTVQTPPSTTPPPAGGNVNVAGTWSQGGVPYYVLSQSGTTVTGNQVFDLTGIGTLPDGFTFSITGTLSGTVSGSTLTATTTFNFTEAAPSIGFNLVCTQLGTLTGTVSGNTMTGTFTAGNFNCTGGSLIGFPSTIAGSTGPFQWTR